MHLQTIYNPWTKLITRGICLSIMLKCADYMKLVHTCMLTTRLVDFPFSWGTFAKIAVDRTTEETVNKYTQTSGGTRGFSLNQVLLHASISRQIIENRHWGNSRHQISLQRHGKVSYTNLKKTQIKKDESDVSSLVNILDNNWTNNPLAEIHQILLV